MSFCAYLAKADEMWNWRFGMLAATMANLAPGRTGRKLKPKDFYPTSRAAPALNERQLRELERRKRKK